MNFAAQKLHFFFACGAVGRGRGAGANLLFDCPFTSTTREVLPKKVVCTEQKYCSTNHHNACNGGGVPYRLLFNFSKTLRDAWLCTARRAHAARQPEVGGQRQRGIHILIAILRLTADP